MRLLTIALLALVFIAAGKAEAQQACAQLNAIADLLMGPKYGEFPAFEGTDSTGAQDMIMFANPKTGTWSMVTVPMPGIACLTFAGKGFKKPREFAKPKPAGKDS